MDTTLISTEGIGSTRDNRERAGRFVGQNLFSEENPILEKKRSSLIHSQASGLFYTHDRPDTTYGTHLWHTKHTKSLVQKISSFVKMNFLHLNPNAGQF